MLSLPAIRTGLLLTSLQKGELQEINSYFLDATLRLCGGVYPAPINRAVTQYEVEQVEYFGKTDYHAFTHVHTRLYFADGSSALAVFRLEAGHNESDLFWSLGNASAFGAGSWMAFGLARDPDVPPPGWTHYQEHERPYTCPKQPELYSLNG